MMKVCQECKAQYEPARFDQKYCCNACRVRAHRRRTEPRTQTVTQTVTRSAKTLTAAEAYRIAGEINPVTGLPNGRNQTDFINAALAAVADLETRMRLMEIDRQHFDEMRVMRDKIERLEKERDKARGMGAVTGKLAEQLLLALAAKIGLGAKETPVTGNEVRPQAIRAEQVVFLPTEDPQEPEQKATKL